MSNFELVAQRGDTIKILVEVLRDGDVVDITGATFWFTAKRAKTDADIDAVIQRSSPGDVELLDAINGKAVITIPPADTASLEDEPRLYCDVQMVELDDTKTTVATGRLTVAFDITRA